MKKTNPRELELSQCQREMFSLFVKYKLTLPETLYIFRRIEWHAFHGIDIEIRASLQRKQDSSMFR